ncbi:M23 family metallopeptidase [Thermus thermophilus]|uniref:M23 family metallopeptidase n=1 Tax=Thermus thermophilus TaxID=274 RepID=UPI000681FAA9|nr:M23 family metallopeptidase [Thermus thermophilus]QMV32304.1 M23 family metallopeptidase [Thermus thermophilus]WMV96477.1 M23 family metallopeptidase [Thermus thermophilus HB27]
MLASPFQGEFRVTNVSDHEYPFQFQDNNGYLFSWWGEKLPGVDGHQGYDFPMPEGTPLLAAYDGEVTFAGWENPFYCPPLDKTVSGLGVVLRHRLPNGEVFLSIYAHMSEVHVKTGNLVRTGQVLGLSGNTGCSTGPHLHFEMRRLRGTAWPVFDPYGWEGEGEDP